MSYRSTFVGLCFSIPVFAVFASLSVSADAKVNDEYTTATISLHGLNLAEPRVWFRLDQRIRSAARKVCRRDRFIQASKQNECIKEAVLKGRLQADEAIARALLRVAPKGSEEDRVWSSTTPATASSEALEQGANDKSAAFQHMAPD